MEGGNGLVSFEFELGWVYFIQPFVCFLFIHFPILVHSHSFIGTFEECRPQLHIQLLLGRIPLHSNLRGKNNCGKGGGTDYCNKFRQFGLKIFPARGNDRSANIESNFCARPLPGRGVNRIIWINLF